MHHALGERELEALALALHAPLHDRVLPRQRCVRLPLLDILQQRLAHLEKRRLHLPLHLLERDVLGALGLLLFGLELRLVSPFR